MSKLTDFISAVFDLRSCPIVDDEFPKYRDEADRQLISLQYLVDSAAHAPKIVCLCGSTKFYDDFVMFNRIETEKGNIVLMPGVFMGSREWVTNYHEVSEKLPKETNLDYKIRLDNLHLRKIDIADEVLVINVDGYIGASTADEIKYAQERNIPVRYAFR
jgi:hypothetical protein